MNPNHRRSLVALMASLMVLACGASKMSPGNDGAGSGGTAGAGATGGSGDGAAAEPSDALSDAPSPEPSAMFRAIHDTIVVTKCGGNDILGQGCHVTNVPTNLLALSDAVTAFANLVNQRTVCRGHPELTGMQVRVVPFDPAGSAIMLVDKDGLCGARHGSLYLSNRGFTAEDLAAIEDWIRQGAQ